METCPVKECGKEIKNRTGLSSHLRNTHNLRLDGKAYKRQAKPKPKPKLVRSTHARRKAKCPYCPAKFNTEHGVSLHIHHAHQDIPNGASVVALTRYEGNRNGLAKRGRVGMTQKKDETLIRLRDVMNEQEILAAVGDVSNVLHRLVQISIDAGARANQIFFNSLCTSAAALENSIYAAKQVERAQSPIHMPSGPTPFGRPQ